MDALTETERRTGEKFERQESGKRSFIATAECVALCKELAPHLAEVIADKLNERTPLMLELRPLGPQVLAIAALSKASQRRQSPSAARFKANCGLVSNRERRGRKSSNPRTPSRPPERLVIASGTGRVPALPRWEIFSKARCWKLCQRSSRCVIRPRP